MLLAPYCVWWNFLCTNGKQPPSTRSKGPNFGNGALKLLAYSIRNTSETGNDIANWVLVTWPCFKTFQVVKKCERCFYSPRFSQANSKQIVCKKKNISKKTGGIIMMHKFDNIFEQPNHPGLVVSPSRFGDLVPLIVFRCGKDGHRGTSIFPYTV